MTELILFACCYEQALQYINNDNLIRSFKRSVKNKNHHKDYLQHVFTLIIHHSLPPKLHRALTYQIIMV
jgi:hypothetical protein